MVRKRRWGSLHTSLTTACARPSPRRSVQILNRVASLKGGTHGEGARSEQPQPDEGDGPGLGAEARLLAGDCTDDGLPAAWAVGEHAGACMGLPPRPPQASRQGGGSRPGSRALDMRDVIATALAAAAAPLLGKAAAMAVAKAGLLGGGAGGSGEGSRAASPSGAIRLRPVPAARKALTAGLVTVGSTAPPPPHGPPVQPRSPGTPHDAAAAEDAATDGMGVAVPARHSRLEEAARAKAVRTPDPLQQQPEPQPEQLVHAVTAGGGATPAAASPQLQPPEAHAAALPAALQGVAKPASLPPAEAGAAVAAAAAAPKAAGRETGRPQLPGQGGPAAPLARAGPQPPAPGNPAFQRRTAAHQVRCRRT